MMQYFLYRNQKQQNFSWFKMIQAIFLILVFGLAMCGCANFKVISNSYLQTVNLKLSNSAKVLKPVIDHFLYENKLHFASKNFKYQLIVSNYQEYHAHNDNIGVDLKNYFLKVSLVYQVYEPQLKKDIILPKRITVKRYLFLPESALSAQSNIINDTITELHQELINQLIIQLVAQITH